jgi:glycosyltransferase involved in cell wall biosynthesis
MTDYKEQLPKVIIMGPGLTQVGGVATFVSILLADTNLKKHFTLLHLDTTRDHSGEGLASRLAFINIKYFLVQTVRFWGLVLKQKPRIIHLPVTSYWAFWKDAVFILMARVAGMKVVAHLHGGLFDQYFRERSRLEKTLIRRTFLLASVIIALSNGWKRFLLEEVREDLNVVVVPNTVDSMFAQAACNPPDTIIRDPNLILFVGGLGHRKGVHEILRSIPIVLERFPEARFIFAGTEEYQGAWEEIQKIWDEIGHNDAAQFLGQVTGFSKLELFFKATVFLLPSYGENFPYALLEAMAAGLPVITTPVGAIPEVVQDGCNGYLIPPGEPGILADRINRVLGDSAAWVKMSVCNRNLIRESYLPSVAIKQIEQIYLQCLSSV